MHFAMKKGNVRRHGPSYNLEVTDDGVINSGFSIRNDFVGRVPLRRRKRAEISLSLFLLLSLLANPLSENPGAMFGVLLCPVGHILGADRWSLREMLA